MTAFISELGLSPPAHTLLVLALIACTGLALGGIRIRGIGLGTAGVLFAGIVFGHFGHEIDHEHLDLLREFGLVLFVFCIGLQIGPGFFGSLRRHGASLNLLAAGIVVMGALLTVAMGWILNIEPAASLGLFSGATTNTPSLGAMHEMLRTLGVSGDPRAALPALAYAVAYPGGILGIIACLLIIRRMYRIDAVQDAAAADAEARGEPLRRMNVVLENPNYVGVRVDELPARVNRPVTISRLLRNGEQHACAATPDCVIRAGDTMLAVGTSTDLAAFRDAVGSETDRNPIAAPSDVTFRRVLVTKSAVLGCSLAEIALPHRFGVMPTRIIRGETEIPPTGNVRLQFGDTLHLVGTDESVNAAAKHVGDSMRKLNRTHFVAIFAGIAIGVLAGTKPFSLPGLPVPLKLGLAGGPLIIAIMLARLGHFNRLVWHMPRNANIAFRELGMTLFLACVGLKAGPYFFANVFSPGGALWLLSAAIITLVPLLAAAIFARSVMKLDFTRISGLLCGSMTDPPALAFASAIAKSDAPAVSYATVYPLTMLLRIIAAQILTLLLWK